MGEAVEVGLALEGLREGRAEEGAVLGEKVGSSVGATEGQDCVAVSTPSNAVAAMLGSLGSHTAEVLWAKALSPMAVTLPGTMMVCRVVQLRP